MPEPILGQVLACLTATEQLSPDVRAVIVAAFGTPALMREVIATVPGAAAPDELADTKQTSPTPEKVYLGSISVSGFRGIANRVTLRLPSSHGLVLVTGRNGSGKSSIAEAAELALTRDTNRAQSTLWREGLQNIHHNSPAEIEIGLRMDGVRDVSIACTFEGDDIGQLNVVVEHDGKPYDLTSHDWDDSISRYRPVLTYGELAALASGKRSDLFDPINKIVGLDGLTMADKQLTQMTTEQNRVIREAATNRAELLNILAASDDPRAVKLHAIFNESRPDVEAASSVLADVSTTVTASRQTLAAWAAISGPDPSEAGQRADALAQALDEVERSTAGATGRAKQLADMLELAINHRGQDDDVCPVCGQTTLDEAWLTDARQRMSDARERATEAAKASTKLSSARRKAQELITPVPTPLMAGATDGVDPSSAAAAWAHMVSLNNLVDSEVGRDRALASELTSSVERVTVDVSALHDAAAHALAAQDGAWQPLAEQARAAVKVITSARLAHTRVEVLSQARAWLRDLTAELRRQRVARFAAEATAIWKGLRQDSNVSLDGIELTGANTRREVHLDLTVDGTPGPHAVLSQGELAALGLSLFLPRSTADESPFRFVLIDDPVQSMDPSKVDGLARVLHQLAATRQVVVFTHDDRLLYALRRLALPATVYLIDRGERSVVMVRQTADPVDQHLNDADALAKDKALPPDLLAMAVSGYCRDAVDEAAIEVARRRLFASGTTVADAEAALSSARTTWARLALALLGDSRKTGRPLEKALAQFGPNTKDTITACVEGVHEPNSTNVTSLVEDIRTLIKALQAMV